MNIGIDQKQAGNIAAVLNQYLADLKTLHAKLQNYHWNLKGSAFFALHAKYEEFYDHLAEEVDEVAERILTLDQQPIGTLKGFLAAAKITEAKDEPISADDSARAVLADFEYLVRELRSAIEVAEENNDPGTADLFTGSMTYYEKNCWMLRAQLQK
ncbi:MAG: DNA starvation/stationary phase protection protein [Spirochaetaceae bacterium]|nr:MAG: DNA starvation/stationary phase protection protein [Spirochaetaceae bacterium]